MDIADIGSETTELITSAAIAAIQRKAQERSFPPTGKCYCCEAPVENKPFCDAECRQDYEDTQRRIGRR
jgi:hypothetical protein